MLTKKVTEVSILFASLIAVAALNYTILHNPYVFLMSFILLIHELGHYFAAKRNSVKSMLPFFIPLPFFPVGVTFTENADEKSRKYISISGAFSASLTLLILMFFNLHYKLFSFYMLFTAFISEVFFNYIGIDGQRYRGLMFNKKIHTNQHIETEFSKESLWKQVINSPYRKKNLQTVLKVN